MNDGKVNWEGNFVAAVTPFTESGDLDTRAFAGNIVRLIDEGADGIVVAGSTGESWALSGAERLQVFRQAVELAAGRVPIIAGTGGISTAGVIELSRQARDAGAAGLLVLPPYYCMPGRRDVIAHYRALSDAVRHPIFLYNIPRRVGFNMTPDVVEELAAIDWVVAIKESSGDFGQVEATIDRVGDRIAVFTGHTSERGVPAAVMGAKGFISSVEPHVMGREAMEMYDLVQRGEIARARAVQLRAFGLDRALSGIGTFPANLKAAMNLLGRNGGYPRLPILPLTSREIDDIRGVLERWQLVAAAV